jgi:hypothetical protein
MLAKITSGMSDDLVSSVIRAWDISPSNATTRRILVAPSMNTQMWLHPITAKQIRILEEEWGVNRTAPGGWYEVLLPQAYVTQVTLLLQEANIMIEVKNLPAETWDKVGVYPSLWHQLVLVAYLEHRCHDGLEGYRRCDRGPTFVDSVNAQNRRNPASTGGWRLIMQLGLRSLWWRVLSGDTPDNRLLVPLLTPIPTSYGISTQEEAWQMRLRGVYDDMQTDARSLD